MYRLVLCLAFALAALAAAQAQAVEQVTFNYREQERTVAGKLLVEAQDGGIVVMGPDTRLWLIEPQDIVSRSRDDNPFEPLASEALSKQLLAEMPEGFRIHTTEHYLICYNTSRAYAEWCGTLYERLYNAFYKYWKDRGLELEPPSAPLVALVFQTEKSYADYALEELGQPISAPYGYYNLYSNRVLTYDLTGVEGAGFGQRQGMSARVNAILSRPGAQQTVATLIHEATHQLAFNSGMHERLADIPRWLSEGMAIYFETPDLKNSRGWTKVGALNELRLLAFREYLRERPADSLATLIMNSDRLTDPRTAKAAYAEAWALNYFLLRTRRKEYMKYLELLAEKPPLVDDSPEQRLADFQAAFGEDVQKLDAAFIKYMLNQRP